VPGVGDDERDPELGGQLRGQGIERVTVESMSDYWRRQP
jgi:hypothetical protein